MYIHYPFCKSKCNYCGFYSVIYNDNQANKYLTSLKKEIDYYKDNYDLAKLKTIYIGGGTPSVSLYLLNKITNILTSCITLSNVLEYTVECNPSNVKNDLIKLLLKAGCNRISLGIQSFDANVINYCNRYQNNKKVFKSIKLLNNAGFNMSIDLINGLPLLKPNVEIEHLDKILSEYTNINHISFYELSIDHKSKFYSYKNLILPKENDKIKYEKQFIKILNKYNFKRYEVSNYSKKGFESKHNLNYWKYNNYAGLGPSAHSTIDSLRIENRADIDEYIDDNNYKTIYHLSNIEQIEEYLLMGLRLTNGIESNDFKKRFNISFEEIFNKTITKYKQYFIINNTIKLNSRGMDKLNKVLVDLFIELEEK